MLQSHGRFNYFKVNYLTLCYIVLVILHDFVRVKLEVYFGQTTGRGGVSFLGVKGHDCATNVTVSEVIRPPLICNTNCTWSGGDFIYGLLLNLIAFGRCSFVTLVSPGSFYLGRYGDPIYVDLDYLKRFLRGLLVHLGRY